MFKLSLALCCLSLLSIGACKSSNDSKTDSANPASKPTGNEYLALGDSIAFGYSPLPPYTQESVDQGLFVGYPEVIAKNMGLTLTSAACPGETTSSFIDPTKIDNGCRTAEPRFHKALKVNYQSSQLDFALKFLKEHPGTRLVTINLGGNDLLLLQTLCDKEANPLLCKLSQIPKATLTLADNYIKIIRAIRDAGYKGDLVATTQPPLDYKDPIQQVALITIRNEIVVLASLTGAKVADFFETMRVATEPFNGLLCDGDFLIRMPDGTCDKHPSLKGAEIAAKTVMDLLK